MKKIEIPEELLKEIIVFYHEPHSLRETCEKFNLSRTVLYRLLTEAQVSLHSKKVNDYLGGRKQTQACLNKAGVTEQEIIDYFNSPHTVNEVCKKFKLSPSTIEAVLENHRIAKHSADIIAKCQTEQLKQSCLKKFGKEYYQQTADYAKQVRETNMSKYGVVYTMQVSEIAEKQSSARRATCQKKYGADSYMHTAEYQERVNQTCLKKYGAIRASGLAETKEKARQTCQARYGVDYYAQSEECQKFKHNYLKYEDIYFDSFPELCFYLYHIKNNLTIERCPIKFKYSFNDEEHYYIPDFKINGTDIIEIKGDHLMKMLLEEGTQDNAKYQCMLTNDVTILTSADYQKYIEWFFEQGYKKEDFLAN